MLFTIAEKQGRVQSAKCRGKAKEKDEEKTKDKRFSPQSSQRTQREEIKA
jgi:hypothetical protein